MMMGALLVAGLLAFGCGDDGGDRPPGPMIMPEAGTPDAMGTADASGTDADASPPAGRGCGPMGECDVGNPASCPMAGQACLMSGSTADGWMTVCGTEGTGAVGEPCMTGMDAQCQQGLQCIGGSCKTLCCTDADCATGSRCGLIGGTEGASGQGAGFCESPDMCTLVPNAGCPMGEGCYLADFTQCAGAGTLATGAACMYLNDCAPGNACVTTSEGGTASCAAFCRLDMAETDCAAGQACTATLMGLPMGIGLCGAAM